MSSLSERFNADVEWAALKGLSQGFSFLPPISISLASFGASESTHGVARSTLLLILQPYKAFEDSLRHLQMQELGCSAMKV